MERQEINIIEILETDREELEVAILGLNKTADRLEQLRDTAEDTYSRQLLTRALKDCANTRELTEQELQIVEEDLLKCANW